MKSSFVPGSSKTGHASKKARRLGADIVFIDEFGYSFAEDLAATWAPRGQTPILKRVTKFRREISTFAGLSISGKLYKRHVKASIKAPDVIAGLEQFRRQIHRPFILIWDRSRVHRSQLVQAYLAEHPDIRMEYLPPYAPELNPQEYCHGTVKHRLKNLNPDDVAAIRKNLDKEFAKLRKQPHILLSFFHYAGLSVKQLW